MILSKLPNSCSCAIRARGEPTEHPPIWALLMPLVNEKQVVLYYSFDQTTVWLLSIGLA